MASNKSTNFYREQSHARREREEYESHNETGLAVENEKIKPKADETPEQKK